MAKTPVTLLVHGLKKPKREVASFSMKFEQSTDSDGQVAAIPRGGKITMRVKALNDGNADLACWMIDKKQAYNGKIEFLNTTDGKLMKTYYFNDAYCVSYNEYWADSVKAEELAHWEEITISCRRITNGGELNFSNVWELVE